MREVAELLLKTNAVTLRINPPYKWVSGILAPIYTDNRILLSYPSERESVIQLLLELIEENNVVFDVIAGVSTSGIPWAAWLAEKLKKPMVYVRPATKDHGKENFIEGKVKENSKVVVVEDLISTGRSALSTVEALRKSNCKVEDCVSIFTYDFEKARDSFNEMGCKLYSLTNFDTLINVATSNGYIKDSEKKQLLEWKKNPEEWGK